MATKYTRYTKAQFVQTMRKMADAYHLAYIGNFVPEVDTYEYVYRMATKNPKVDILIYSAIDKRTNKMRDNGKDAVRLIMRWQTKNGYIYKHLAKHLRIETLFVNIRKTLVDSVASVFNLNYKEFHKKNSVMG